MVGIYKYENGLKFTGIIAPDKETAEKFLSEKYGCYGKKYVGRDENGYPKWEECFLPGYNKDAFEILEVSIIE